MTGVSSLKLCRQSLALACKSKTFLGHKNSVPLCTDENIICKFRSELPLGKFEPEDAILPLTKGEQEIMLI